MSFSTDIKQELNKISNLKNKEFVKFELIGYLITVNTSIISKKNIKFSTESDYNINRFSRLLSNLDIDHKIDIKGKNFNIITKFLDISKLEFIEIREKDIILSDDILEINKEELMKAIIRGSFLGAGSINNPQNSYHLEIVFSNEINLQIVKKILTNLNINIKELKNSNRSSLYIKDGEEIAKFLALIGANQAVMDFENIRIEKEIRGKVNRIVNCETANLSKTINASIEQIAAIKKLQKNGQFNKLDDKLKEVAILRIENPDISLIELGKKLKKPVGKSGVNYRLKKIMEIADEK